MNHPGGETRPSPRFGGRAVPSVVNGLNRGHISLSQPLKRVFDEATADPLTPESLLDIDRIDKSQFPRLDHGRNRFPFVDPPDQEPRKRAIDLGNKAESRRFIEPGVKPCHHLSVGLWLQPHVGTRRAAAKFNPGALNLLQIRSTPRPDGRFHRRFLKKIPKASEIRVMFTLGYPHDH